MAGCNFAHHTKPDVIMQSKGQKASYWGSTSKSSYVAQGSYSHRSHRVMKSNRLQAYELPTQLTAWAAMKDITKDEKLKQEAVLLNHVTKTVIINFRTEHDARLAHKWMSKKKVVFKAPRVRTPMKRSKLLSRSLGTYLQFATERDSRALAQL